MYIYTYSLHMYLYIYIYKRRYINGRYQKIYERITKGNDGEKIYEEEKELSFLINWGTGDVCQGNGGKVIEANLISS